MTKSEFPKFPVDLLSRCSRLWKMNLRNNMIRDFSHLAQVPFESSITNLWLENNKVEVIPDCVSRLVNLESLELTNNLIQVVPEEVCHCTKLQGLFLGGNRIREFRFPKAERLLPHLTSIVTEKNAALEEAVQVKVFERREAAHKVVEDLVYAFGPLQLCRSVALMLIWARRECPHTVLRTLPKELVRMLAQSVYATRRDVAWRLSDSAPSL